MPLICIASPKGGVGKTTLAANLADALQRLGRRVLAIDFDPQNTLRLHFGISLQDGAGFAAHLPDRPDWRDALRHTASGVLLLPHGAAGLKRLLANTEGLARDPEALLAPMRGLLADPALLVIADTPPGPGQVLAQLAPLAALTLAVLLADATSASLLPAILSGGHLGQGALATAPAARLRVLLNQVELDARLSHAAADAVARLAGPRLIGAVARDHAVTEAIASQQLLLDFAPDGRAAQDLLELARNVDTALPAATPTHFAQRKTG